MDDNGGRSPTTPEPGVSSGKGNLTSDTPNDRVLSDTSNDRVLSDTSNDRVLSDTPNDLVSTFYYFSEIEHRPDSRTSKSADDNDTYPVVLFGLLMLGLFVLMLYALRWIFIASITTTVLACIALAVAGMQSYRKWGGIPRAGFSVTISVAMLVIGTALVWAGSVWTDIPRVGNIWTVYQNIASSSGGLAGIVRGLTANVNGVDSFGPIAFSLLGIAVLVVGTLFVCWWLVCWFAALREIPNERRRNATYRTLSIRLAFTFSRFGSANVVALLVILLLAYSLVGGWITGFYENLQKNLPVPPPQGPSVTSPSTTTPTQSVPLTSSTITTNG